MDSAARRNEDAAGEVIWRRSKQQQRHVILAQASSHRTRPWIPGRTLRWCASPFNAEVEFADGKIAR
jgi:hypothetical protein